MVSIAIDERSHYTANHTRNMVTMGGAGYPQKMSGAFIPREVRLLTILDIFEALTARDRPYKKPMSVERSLEILYSMAKEGSIDEEILGLFVQSRAWEAVL